MEFVLDNEGFMTERSIRDLAAWYSGNGDDRGAFEAHLTVLKAANALITAAQRGRRGDITAERYVLLRLLFCTPERRMLMGEIGRSLNVSPTSVTKLVDGLVPQGLVRRVPDAQDHRRTWIEILDKGVAIVEDILPNVRHYTRERWKGMSAEEQRLVVHLLSKLMFTLQSAGVDDVISRHVTGEASALTN
jgi:DNA-binding MarR family transcriptional regulator